ncbi:hypothetical protein MN608_09789 [Microdochium nivale]|nr:hypothetical protein MN608_09789 [Microdochium nivale]
MSSQFRRHATSTSVSVQLSLPGAKGQPVAFSSSPAFSAARQASHVSSGRDEHGVAIFMMHFWTIAQNRCKYLNVVPCPWLATWHQASPFKRLLRQTRLEFAPEKLLG